MGKALILAALVLAGCATTPAPVQNPRQVWCDTNQPRRPSVASVEAMQREELDEINAYNRQGSAWCGWRP